ncbi:MAG: HU family DNA-binding protein [Nitrospirae bacterium]|nr:HU family DNA-binding protein [Nitrospirota bacterium]
MNKAELIDSIAKPADLTKSNATKVLDALVSIVIEATCKGDKVHLGGLGMFRVVERKQREGRNVRAGEPITIPAARVPKFTEAKGFRDAVNSGSNIE